MKISQREARRLKKQVIVLLANERRRFNAYATDWALGWVNIDSFILSDSQYARVVTARRLGCAVIMVPSGRGTEVRLYADRIL